MGSIRMNRKTVACLTLFTVIVSAPVASARDEGGVEVRIESSGSTPPIGSIFDCATSLRGNPFSKVATQNCLNQLLKTGYFEEGSFRVERSDAKFLVVFHLKSPLLTVSQLSLEFTDPDKSNLEVSLDNNPDVLRSGRIYTQESELATSMHIHEFFFLQGRRIGLRSQTKLNFETKVATLTYSAVEAPPGPGPGDVEPYSIEKDCKELIAVVDFQNVDDYVPLSLAQRLMKIHFGACYDPTSIQEDAETLRNTRLFQNVELSTKGTGNRRTLVAAISGKPLPVRSLSVKCYGEQESYCQSIARELPLKPGSIYSRSADWRAKRQIEDTLKKPQRNLWVFEDISSDGNSGLTIVYGAIFERAELFVNGKDVPSYDGPPISRLFDSH
jgi:outer membrane protein assembly factor BamA